RHTRSKRDWSSDVCSSDLPGSGCCFLLLFGSEEAESVGALPVLPHLEVEMVSGRVPGGAYIANHLALLDLLACHHTDGGTVGIRSEERRVAKERIAGGAAE